MMEIGVLDFRPETIRSLAFAVKASSAAIACQSSLRLLAEFFVGTGWIRRLIDWGISSSASWYADYFVELLTGVPDCFVLFAETVATKPFDSLSRLSGWVAR